MVRLARARQPMPKPNHEATVHLKDIKSQISACRLCIDEPLNQPLPHQPRPVVQVSTRARICIAGQAPGLRVHESGLPFDDRSGDRLRQWMAISREHFYDENRLAIIPMGFCFPGYDAKGSDLPPRKECAPAWRQRLFDTMPQVELILVIGMYAQSWHMGSERGKTMTETVANWRDSFDKARQPKILPMPHPSWRNTGWVRKNPWFERDLLPVLQNEVSRLTGD